MRRVGLLSFSVLASWVVSPIAVAQPAFDLGFGSCLNSEGAPGSAFSAEFVATVSTTNAGVGQGAQGWSISISASSGLTISAPTTAGTVGANAPDGLRSGGFEKTEVSNTATSVGDCAGASGAVSAIVLSFTEPITLPEGSNTQRILRLVVAGTYPGEGQCSAVSVAFTDGCRGSGQPVDNRVTSEGNTIIPTNGRCEFMICGAVPPPICPDPAGPLQVVIQSAIPAGGNHIVGAPFAGGNPPGLASTPDPLQPAQVSGTPGEITVYAAIVSQLASGTSGGVQGWSLSAAVKGDITLVGVTTNGTAAANAPGGLRSGGFEKTESVNPALVENMGPGAVSAIVLSFTEPITLDPDSTGTVLCFTVSGDDGDTGQICWRDGLRGSGQPVNNVATVAGETRMYTCCQAVNIAFVAPQVSDFIRCDPNNDGENDIADAVWIVNELFRGGPATACPAAADCDSDGMETISDAIFAVTYQFRGGSAPAAPFPSCGGREALSDPSQCPSGSTSCP